jgi:hypothetical protein
MSVAHTQFIRRFEMGWISLPQTAPPSESLMYFIPLDASMVVKL